MSRPLPPLVETLKKAATVLREAGIPYGLAGGGAAYARGAAPPMHDVDFVLMEGDIDAAAQAFGAAGRLLPRSVTVRRRASVRASAAARYPTGLSGRGGP